MADKIVREDQERVEANEEAAREKAKEEEREAREKSEAK